MYPQNYLITLIYNNQDRIVKIILIIKFNKIAIIMIYKKMKFKLKIFNCFKIVLNKKWISKINWKKINNNKWMTKIYIIRK
jgi:hypothetical protein